MNQKVVGKAAQDVVDSITPTAKKWMDYLKVKPGEIEENLARLHKDGKTIRLPFKNAVKMDIPNVSGNADEYITLNGMKSMGFTEDEFKKTYDLINNMTTDNADDVIKTIKNLAGTDNQDRADYIEGTIDMLEDAVNNAMDGIKEAAERTGGKFSPLTGPNKWINMPRAYFDVEDQAARKVRIGTAVGGYAALNVGGRYLSGGTLTRDNYGQKDIAGVPFI